MEEKANNYLEMYPIYKILQNDIETKIDKNIKYVQISKDVSSYGRMIYDKDIENVKIEYSLQNGKFINQLIEALKQIYSMYQDVNIDFELNNDTVINKLMKSSLLTVRIPCEFNKKCYLVLDIAKKQQLRLEAANNIKSGLVLFEESKKI